MAPKARYPRRGEYYDLPSFDGGPLPVKKKITTVRLFTFILLCCVVAILIFLLAILVKATFLDGNINDLRIILRMSFLGGVLSGIYALLERQGRKIIIIAMFIMFVTALISGVIILPYDLAVLFSN